jgi:hypothetical protein
MSNRTRRLKSKAMQDRWTYNRDSQGKIIQRSKITVNNGAVQNGGSNLMRIRNNSVIRRNNINHGGSGNILNSTLSSSCCGSGSKVESKPVVHYSYTNYLNRKNRTCTRKDPAGNRCNNIYQKMPDIGNNGGFEFYLENKKSCVLLKEERNDDGTKRSEPTDIGKISYPSASSCCDPNDKLRILANNVSTPGFTPVNAVVGNGFKKKTTYSKQIGKSYAQIRREKKPTVTKPMQFNYASLQIARKKARRNISGKSGTCNRSTPFERANANIQSC